MDGEGELEYEDVLKLVIFFIIELFKCIIFYGGNVYYMWDWDDLEIVRIFIFVVERKGVMDIWSVV